MKKIITVGLVGLSMLAPGTAARATETPGGNIIMELVNLYGTGCSNSDTEIYTTPSKTILTLVHERMIAEAPVRAGSGHGDQVNCIANIRVSYPKGYTFGVTSVNYRGNAALDASTSAKFMASYRYVGTPNIGFVEEYYKGLLNQDFHISRSNDRVIYAPCGGEEMLVVEQAMSATATGAGTARISMLAQEHNAATRLNLDWKEC